MVTLNNIIDASGLSDTAKAAAHAAVSSRGKTKGLLKSSKPADGVAAAAWLGLMVNLAPQRAGIWTLMMLGNDQKDIFTEISDYFDPKHGDGLWWHSLNSIGQRPYQFNLYAHHNDPQTAIDFWQARTDK